MRQYFGRYLCALAPDKTKSGTVLQRRALAKTQLLIGCTRSVTPVYLISADLDLTGDRVAPKPEGRAGALPLQCSS